MHIRFGVVGALNTMVYHWVALGTPFVGLMGHRFVSYARGSSPQMTACRPVWKVNKASDCMILHRYGLVYPGVGWVIFRSKDYLPESLVFHDNYL